MRDNQVFLYNTFDKLNYSDRVLLKFAMFDWCEDNIGEKGVDWDNSNDMWEWRKFYFKNEADALAFKMRFAHLD
jgi:hypothetical protein